MRIAIGGISHESSTFATVPTRLDDFKLRSGAAGPELLERFEGYTDLIVVGLIIALGAAMLIGLLTANGKVTW